MFQDRRIYDAQAGDLKIHKLLLGIKIHCRLQNLIFLD